MVNGNGMIRPIPDITTNEYDGNPVLALYKVAKQLEENQRVICTKISLKNEEQDKERNELKSRIESLIDCQNNCKDEMGERVGKNSDQLKELMVRRSEKDEIRDDTRKDKMLKWARHGYRITEVGVFLAFAYFLIDKIWL